MTVLADHHVDRHALASTWIGIGGRADHLARPQSTQELGELLRQFAGQPVRVLGDGANVLIDDDGVDGLVVSLANFDDVSPVDGDPAVLRVGAGVNLPKLITRCVREGLAGLEGLAGIPASVGGAVRMNAGGMFGEIAQTVRAVDAMTILGEPERLEREQIEFSYRHSGLEHLIITHVELGLRAVPSGEQPALRQKLKDVMAYKKHSQPMANDSAGCAFKNPVVAGIRTSAGKLIDQAGCKGMRVGGAEVSDLHANFIVTESGCKAQDVIALMDAVRTRVLAHHDIAIEPEIVIWTRSTKGEGA